VFTDKLSGSAKTVRPGLVALIDYARPGDNVVIARLPRVSTHLARYSGNHTNSKMPVGMPFS